MLTWHTGKPGMAIWYIGLASLARRRFYKNHNLLSLNRQHLGLGLSLTGSRWRSYIAPEVDTRQGKNVFQYVFIVYKDHFLKTLNIISVKVFIFVHVFSCILYFVYVGMIRTCLCIGICIPFGIHMCNVDRVAPLLFVSIVFVLSLVYGPMC